MIKFIIHEFDIYVNHDTRAMRGFIKDTLHSHTAWLAQHEIQARYSVAGWETMAYQNTIEQGVRVKFRLDFESVTDLALYKLLGLEHQELSRFGQEWESLKINSLHRILSP